MTPSEFNATFLPYAQKVATGTGLLPGLFLAQWADETALASSFAGTYNLGNITRGGVAYGFVNYGSYDEFVSAEILLLHAVPYEGVLASAGKTLGEQCMALGKSPWDGGHYVGAPPFNYPGGALVAYLPEFGMSAQELSEELTVTDQRGLVQLAYISCMGHSAPTETDITNGIAQVAISLEGFVDNLYFDPRSVAYRAELAKAGLPGPAGPAGPTGPQGPTGPTGQQGPPPDATSIHNAILAFFKALLGL